MFHAILICSDEDCAVEVEAWGELEELDLLVCDGCDCVLQVLSLSEGERAPAQVVQLPRRAGAASAPRGVNAQSQRPMTLQPMDNVLIVVADLEAAVPFAPNSAWSWRPRRRSRGLGGQHRRAATASVATRATIRHPRRPPPCRLSQFHSPPAVRAEPGTRRRTRWACATHARCRGHRRRRARLRSRGAELVGEITPTRTSTGSASTSPCWHHHRTGRAAAARTPQLRRPPPRRETCARP